MEKVAAPREKRAAAKSSEDPPQRRNRSGGALPALANEASMSQYEVGSDPTPGDNEVTALVAAERHWPMIVGVMVAAGIAAYLACHALTPLYTAESSIMFNPREPEKTAINLDPNSALPPSEETVRKNEIAIIRSRKLVERVVSDMHLAGDPEFNPDLRAPSRRQELIEKGKKLVERWLAAVLPYAPVWTEGRSSDPQRVLDQAVDIFLRKLGTTEVEASRVVKIRFSSDDPERAARVANAVAEQYIHQRVSEDRSAAEAASLALHGEIDALNMKIRDSERAIASMHSAQGLLPASDLTFLSGQMAELNKELITASAQRATAASRLAELSSARASKRLDTIGPALGSPLIQRLREHADQLAARIADMSSTYGDAYPAIVRARAELNDYRAKIDVEVQKVASTYKDELAVAKAREAELRNMVEWTRRQIVKAGTSEVDVRAAEREADANRSLRTQLVSRLNDTEAQVAQKTPKARIISEATVPHSPSFPPKLVITTVAAIFGATGAIILALLIERRDRSIRSTAQLRQITNARVFGFLPTIKAMAGRALPPSRVLAERGSMFVENLRAVWFQIDHCRQLNARTFLITSSVSNEGKSSVATSLARLLALNGRRVVIVDADLRCPTVHRMFGLQQAPGLAELVEQKQAIADGLQTDGPSGAVVLPAGVAHSSPAEILQSPRLSKILEELAASFDAVIIDTPPVLAVHDVEIIARHVDMTVMVVRWGTTKASAFATALQRFADLSIPVRGVILSMVDRKRYERYGWPDGETFSRSMRKYYSR
jgi:capsular exopolysaccharide synthesis family protein